MQKSKQIGVLLEDLSASQLTFYVIKNINDYLEKSILRPNNISHPKSRIDFLNLIKE